MMLAGIILVLSFVVTALTLSQIADLEKEAAREQSSPLLTEYRAMRAKIGATLKDATGTGTTNSTFNTTFASIVSSVKGVEAAKGYDVQIYLAGAPSKVGVVLNRTEWSFTDLGKPNNYTLGAPTAGRPAPETWAWQKVANYSFHTFDSAVKFREVQNDWATPNVPYDKVNDGIVWRQTGCLKPPATSCIQAAIVYVRLADSSTSVEETIAYPVNVP